MTRAVLIALCALWSTAAGAQTPNAWTLVNTGSPVTRYYCAHWMRCLTCVGGSAAGAPCDPIEAGTTFNTCTGGGTCTGPQPSVGLNTAPAHGSFVGMLYGVAHICVGGASAGNVCRTTSAGTDCPGGTCEADGKLFYFGGGHGNTADNDVYIFDTLTNRWTQKYAPEGARPCCELPTCNGGTNVYNSCTTSAQCPSGSCDQWRCRPTGDSICGDLLNCSCGIASGGTLSGISPLGRPSADHNFQRKTYDPNGDDPDSSGVGYGSWILGAGNGTWEYTERTNSWTHVDLPYPYQTGGVGLPFNTTSGYITSLVMFYDPTLHMNNATQGVIAMETYAFFHRAMRMVRGTPTLYVEAGSPYGTSEPWPSSSPAEETYECYDSTRALHLLSRPTQGMWWYNAASTPDSYTALPAPPSFVKGYQNVFPSSCTYDIADQAVICAVVADVSGTLALVALDQAGNWTQLAPVNAGPASVGNGGSQAIAPRFHQLLYDTTTGYVYYTNVQGGDTGSGTADLNGINTYIFNPSGAFGTPGPTATVTQTSAVTSTPTPSPTPSQTPTGPPLGGVFPALAFVDLDSGPKSGNTDTSRGQTSGVDGAIVSLWGVNLGSTQSGSTISVGGAAVSTVYYWGNAVPPYSPATLFNTYQRMQVVIFQVPSTAADGAGTISVTVGGITSNTLPFTVRSGRIFYVCTASGCGTGSAAGNDSAGGTWQAPWLTFSRANSNATTPGDIVYFGDGMTGGGGGLSIQAAGCSFVGVPPSGTATCTPIAWVAYPGATVTIGSTLSDQVSFYGWDSSSGNPWIATYPGLGQGAYRTYAKFYWRAAQRAVHLQEGGRLVGSEIEVPNGDTAVGALQTRGSHIRVYGNEVYNCGNSTSGSALYHTVYLTAYRDLYANAGDSQTETDHDVGWNYLHDNHAAMGFNVYTEELSTNSPLYSNLMTDWSLHHNVVMNQASNGIQLGNMANGDNWVFNNIIVAAGQPIPGEPQPPIYQYAGINLRGGVGHGTTVGRIFHVLNNTLVNNGYYNPATGASTGDIVMANVTYWTPDFHNNLVSQTNPNNQPYVFTSGETVLADPTHFSNDLWYGTGFPPTFESSALNVDPLFRATNDFHLSAGSPAIGAGLTESAVLTDFDGVVRPQGSAYDIGVYEFITAGTPTPTATLTPTPQRPLAPVLRGTPAP